MQIFLHQMFGGMLRQLKFQRNLGLLRFALIMKPVFQLRNGMRDA
jgi:hypothetical protein